MSKMRLATLPSELLNVHTVDSAYRNIPVLGNIGYKIYSFLTPDSVLMTGFDCTNSAFIHSPTLVLDTVSACGLWGCSPGL